MATACTQISNGWVSAIDVGSPSVLQLQQLFITQLQPQKSGAVDWPDFAVVCLLLALSMVLTHLPRGPITNQTPRCCWAWAGKWPRNEWNSAAYPQLPIPFVPHLDPIFSQLQKCPISKQMTDSSQNLTTWLLSIGNSPKAEQDPGQMGSKIQQQGSRMAVEHCKALVALFSF